VRSGGEGAGGGGVRSERHQHRKLSDWASVRRWENATRERLRRHHALWLHGWCIGLIVLGAMWGAAHLQMMLGSDSLAMRYLITLGAGYLAFLFMLRWWAGALVRERGQGGNLPDLGGDLPIPQGKFEFASDGSALQAGGGDFGGGGASGSFELPSDAASSAVGDIASGALEAAGSADEGAVVVIPVVVVFLAGCLVLFGVGSLLMLYFGSEALLAVAVEVAFGYVSGRTAVRIAREGWLGIAVRLTWKPLLGALVCAVLLGALIDRFVPQAHSLPQAVKMLRK
jgi:hypothetical protein